MRGAAEMEKGPFRADLRQARQHYETALKLATAQESSDPKVAAMIPKIKQALTALTDLFDGPMGLGPAGLPFPAAGKGPTPGGIYTMLEEMMEAGLDPDDLFDPDDDEGWFPAPAPAPRPRRKSKKR
jgi:hypothetical protein